MATGEKVVLAKSGANQEIRQEPGEVIRISDGTQMEAPMLPVDPMQFMDPELKPDMEFVGFCETLVGGMPEGQALGMAEARVDYLLQQISEDVQRMDRVKATRDARILMIKNQAADECEKLERKIAYAESVVRLHVPFDGQGFKKLYGNKSLSLPHGKVGYKQHRATVEIRDAENALHFAKEHGLEITVRESVGKTPLIEHVIRSGEEPQERDGFEFIPARDEFFVSPDLEF